MWANFSRAIRIMYLIMFKVYWKMQMHELSGNVLVDELISKPPQNRRGLFLKMKYSIHNFCSFSQRHYCVLANITVPLVEPWVKLILNFVKESVKYAPFNPVKGPEVVDKLRLVEPLLEQDCMLEPV